jgi:hypothetical protein
MTSDEDIEKHSGNTRDNKGEIQAGFFNKSNKFSGQNSRIHLELKKSYHFYISISFSEYVAINR